MLSCRKGTRSWGIAREKDSLVDCVLLCSRLCMIMLLCRKGTRLWGVAREPDSVVVMYHCAVDCV